MVTCWRVYGNLLRACSRSGVLTSSGISSPTYSAHGGLTSMRFVHRLIVGGVLTSIRFCVGVGGHETSNRRVQVHGS